MDTDYEEEEKEKQHPQPIFQQKQQMNRFQKIMDDCKQCLCLTNPTKQPRFMVFYYSLTRSLIPFFHLFIYYHHQRLELLEALMDEAGIHRPATLTNLTLSASQDAILDRMAVRIMASMCCKIAIPNREGLVVPSGLCLCTPPGTGKTAYFMPEILSFCMLISSALAMISQRRTGGVSTKRITHSCFSPSFFSSLILDFSFFSECSYTDGVHQKESRVGYNRGTNKSV